jgi:hypothetical protein
VLIVAALMLVGALPARPHPGNRGKSQWNPRVVLPIMIVLLVTGRLQCRAVEAARFTKGHI